MARKSRKNIVEPNSIQKERIYNTAIYARISVEDKQSTDSLENQVYFIKQFVEDRSFLNVCGIYIDSGETGTNFDRPQFIQMMKGVKAGRINCIIVKDLSRFGRNYIEMGNYLEKIFPYLGVRFISINDNYDTNNPYNNSETLAIALKSLIHDIYAKDISRKISTAFEAKQRKGEFVGGAIPYGYLKDPVHKNKLIIDEEAASVVRTIFMWKSEKMGTAQIARRLNDTGILSSRKALWIPSTIKRILQNPVYTGCLVHGRQKSRFYLGWQGRRTESDDWIIINDTHEPIIDKITFDKVQDILQSITCKYHEKAGKYADVGNSENVFLNLIRCADCGKNLSRYKNVYSNGVYYAFICPTHTVNGESACSKKYINEKTLIKAVFGYIKKEIELFVDIEKLIRNLENSKSEKLKAKSLKEQIADFKQGIQKKSNRLNILYADYADEILTKDEYIFAKTKYTAELKFYRQKLDELMEQERLYSDTLISDNKWINALSKWASCQNEPQLSRKMLVELVEHIEVCEYNRIEVFFRHRDGYMELQKFASERGGDDE